MEIFNQLKIYLPYNQDIQFLCIYQEKMKLMSTQKFLQYIHSSVIHNTQNGNNLKVHQLVIKQMCHIHIVGYYLAIGRS